MRTLSDSPYTEIELRWDRELTGPSQTRARQLRGALAECFSDDPLFHQHDKQGQVLYRYPRVQYRWQEGRGVIAGWGEAARRLPALSWLELELRLGEDSVQVADISLTTHRAQFGVEDWLLRYRFNTPALLLNQKNYHHYRELDEVGRRDQLDRLLVAQLLTALRGLGVHFDTRLYAAFTRTRTVSSHYKQQELVGLVGQFATNAVLPAGLGVGHGVSHGFGWIVPT